MPADFSFRVIPHQAQRPVGCVFAHWLVRIMIAGKHQIQMAGKLLYLFQKGNRLAGERYDMRSTHFCATPRKPNFVDGLAGGGDGPDFVPEIDLAPAGETQFAGTDEQVQCQHLRQPG